jgi:hypothetical protein
LQISTLSTKGRAVVVGCLLLTLFFANFYFSVESINTHFLSVVSGIWTGDQPKTNLASEGNPNSVNERNNITVNKSVIKNSSSPPEQRLLKNLTDVNSTSFIRNTEVVSMNESRRVALTGLEAEPVPGERHILFLETLCVLNDSVRGNQSGLAITPRQACAVASAANTNHDIKVYLLYTCSVIGNLGDSQEYVKQMLSYSNVRIWKLVISDYIKGTPLDNWDFIGNIRSSDWPVVHASDILRYITLWKYGGTYLDMDFVIRK